ncbi:hypothetical protein SCATT_36170 [Streptantibioticus cattleyicolor NRRL 8057 = DSM 46488]|uniref:Uncharacterized protein n=1 Tax=Streptantibioticus cattleyicolor (strain ATCC 35852 / DSM 46488 / JCM 4925 / NBRC 14057 / NRRL 8057) TaxID=1003195 RepID=G8WX83_STREN|nr:hypothetical protein SCATT_36170 [Streptantibioticus cattleyicolor NRRL 8057 = DSM 46488]
MGRAEGRPDALIRGGRRAASGDPARVERRRSPWLALSIHV